MTSDEQIAAHLFLEAVVPAFEELANVSTRAAELMRNWNCSVEFAVRKIGSTTLRFACGAVSIAPVPHPPAELSLFFFSAGHLSNQMRGQGFGMPLPRRGLLQLKSLRRFEQISSIFEQEVDVQQRLLLRVALAAFSSLSLHDGRVREILRDAPDGIAELGVPGQMTGWVECRDGRLSSGLGRPLRSADVLIHFRNEAIALAALRGELDELAATGSGDLRVRGLIPLADLLGAVAARTARLLPR